MKENGFETLFSVSHNFSLIIVLHLGRHLEYIEMLNDARVASLGFFKDNVCTTRISKEKKFKIKFQVPLKFAWILPDYILLQTCRIFLPYHFIESKLLLKTYEQSTLFTQSLSNQTFYFGLSVVRHKRKWFVCTVKPVKNDHSQNDQN